MVSRVFGMYFSGTGTTKKVVGSLGKKISYILKKEYEEYDFTKCINREKNYVFCKDDLVIIGLPTYAGRLPNVLLDFLSQIEGNGAYGIPIVMFGNRNYDDSLLELRNIMKKNGFNIVAGGAFVGEHSFSYELAKGRPDENDIKEVEEFAFEITSSLEKFDVFNVDFSDSVYGVEDKGEEIRKYYKPRDRKGNYINILKVKPKVNDNCNDCKLCVSLCPMNAIDYDDVSKYNNICIKCGACIKGCPQNARYYDDEGFLYHKSELEEEYGSVKTNVVFVMGN